MRLFHPGWWRIPVLVIGSILLVLIGFFAAMVINGRGPAPEGPVVASADGGAEAGAGTGKKDEDKDKEIASEKKKAGKTLGKIGGKKGKKAAKVLGLMPTSALKLLDSRSTSVGNQVADKTAEGVGEVATPGIHVASNAAQGMLPPFLAKQVPWVASYAEYESKAETRAAVEHAADDQMESLKEGREAGKDGEGDTEEDDAADNGASAGKAEGVRPLTPAAGAATEAASDMSVATLQPSVRPAARTSIWTIELGRFATLHNAEDFAGDISRQGYGAHVFVDNTDNRYWYSVRAGSFATSGAADAGLDRMRKLGLDGTVVSELGGTK